MIHGVDNNKVCLDNNDHQEEPFQYNFISIPWDERSNYSKIGIIVLLVSIFIATLACVFNYIKIQYNGHLGKTSTSDKILTCHMVKVDDFRYIARIYSISNHKAVCVGAVMRDTIVLTNEDCVQSGPILVRVGSWSEPRCRKSFAVDIIDNLRYSDHGTNKLVLLRTLENMNECASIIVVGSKLDWNGTADVIGRVQHGGKLLSRQPVTVMGKNCSSNVYGQLEIKETSPTKDLICVKATAKCPIISSDLLVQDGKLYGVSLSTTTAFNHRNQFVNFSDVTAINDLINNSDF